MQFLRHTFQAFLNAKHNLVRRLQRTTRSRAYIDKQYPLVFIRHETGLRRVHQNHQQHHRASQQRPRQPAAFDKEQHRTFILLNHHIKSRIECPAETCSEIILLRAVFINIRSQQQGAKRRTQRQSVNGRDTYGNRHRQSELGVERTGRATHERHRNKHRHKYQRRGDNRITDTFHCVDTCHIRRLIPYVETRLHRLDDDYGIIHHRTNHEHQGEQRYQVDTESCHCHESKRTNQRNHDTHQRNQRGTDVLQEDIHHQDNEDDRLNQCLHHLMDRSEKEVVGAHHLREFYAFRQVLAHFIQQFVDVLVHFCCIGTGRLEHHAGHAVMPVHAAFVGVAVLTQLDVCYIFQFQHFAVFRRTDYDFTEFLRCDETAFILHGILVSLVRVLTERTGSRLDVLLGKHCRYIRRNQFVLRHHIGFHPDAHTVVTTHNHHIAHT